MSVTRRDFIEATAVGCTGLMAGSLFPFSHVWASGKTPSTDPVIPGATGERIADAMTFLFRPYRSQIADSADVTTWVQIDLGSAQPIDTVRLYPLAIAHRTHSGFPLRFHFECADDPQFKVRRRIVEWSKRDFPNPGDRIVEFRADRATARYVRFTATRLTAIEKHAHLTEFSPEAYKAVLPLIEGKYRLALGKIEVISQGRDIAVHRPVTVDSAYGNPDDAQQLTRAPRPQGEGLVTDNPQNVSEPQDWRPVSYRAEAPLDGVRLQEGLFLSAMQNNIRYLLDSCTLDDLLHDFRKRAGKPVPALNRAQTLWDTILTGSGAGRFLMGAGTTLRWLEHGELRQRMDALVDGIAQCSEPDGYIMAYSKDTFFYSERGAYTRSWVTHGLIEAGCSGNAGAFELLRGYYDWYNKQDFLPLALRACNFGPQGTVANTRMYFTPVGRPEDLRIVQRYMQENYWLQALAARKAEAIWQYPYDRPHSYVITFLEPYLDLYRATGDRQYLDAVQGGWDLFRDHWQNVGGSFSIIESEEPCPPKSYSLLRKMGETCGNAFWIALNQRLHQLHPDDERYVAEIEKSIYNVILANVDSPKGIRYYSMLMGKKTPHLHENSCCEGQGSRIAGSLPEYIYSIAEDGLYVNLFEASEISWQHRGEAIRMEMQTRFPNNPAVKLTLHMAAPAQAKIRIRTPCWAAGSMPIEVNGTRVSTGAAGTYVMLDRTWSQGDVISFTLPMEFKLTRYVGEDRLEHHERYALEYGPLLMAALGSPDGRIELKVSDSITELLPRLTPQPDRPLHFRMPLSAVEWRPYYEVSDETFSCFPIIDFTQSIL